TGCSTTGSSEAAMLGGLALKWLWRARMRSAGKPTDRPNLVLGVNVQVCWDKFCRYWDVEPRLVPMEGDRFHMTAETALPYCDEAALPRDLVFNVNYLGGSMPTFALNFSRPGSEVLAQYYMFLALGQDGYRDIQRGSSRVAQHIAREIAKIGPYRLITDGSELP